MSTFPDLVASRQAWIADVLRPWCRQAALKELKLAEQEWPNLAGKVDPEGTLWAWAWSRFPSLVNTELWKIDETHPIRIELTNGQTFTGYPDGRQSQNGSLILLCEDPDSPRRSKQTGPFRLDELISVTRASAD